MSEVVKIEVAHILDDGTTGLSISEHGGFEMLPYTNPNVLRFSRARDAASFKVFMYNHDNGSLAQKVRPVEHSWG